MKRDGLISRAEFRAIVADQVEALKAKFREAGDNITAELDGRVASGELDSVSANNVKAHLRQLYDALVEKFQAELVASECKLFSPGYKPEE
jgi:hypothetical protein